MGEPAVITYKEVAKATDTYAGSVELWNKIGEITGAGHIPVSPEGNAAPIDLTSVSDAKRAQIERLLSKASGGEDAAAEPQAAKQAGKKESK